jgi:hypothetical protein
VLLAWLNRRVVLAPILKLVHVRSAVGWFWLTVTTVPPPCPAAPVADADDAAVGNAAPDHNLGLATIAAGLTHKPPGVRPSGTGVGVAFFAANDWAA